MQLRYKSAVGYCSEGMHLSIHQTIVLEGCISQYIRLLYWRDASLDIALERCMDVSSLES